jgi:glycosyl transferase family 25
LPHKDLPLYVISLARRPERRAAMQARLGALGLAFSFIEAVDGLHPIPDLERTYNPQKRLRIYGTELSPYEIACGLSHLQACETIAASPEGIGLILEDDALPAPELPAVIAAIKKLEQKFDVIRLAGIRPRPTKLVQKLDATHSLARLYGGACGAQAYVITAEGARKFIKYALPFTQQIDILLDEYYFNGLNTYAVQPYPVMVDEESPSTIPARARNDCRHKRALFYRIMPRKWPSDIARYLYHWRHYRLGAG